MSEVLSSMDELLKRAYKQGFDKALSIAFGFTEFNTIEDLKKAVLEEYEEELKERADVK